MKPLTTLLFSAGLLLAAGPAAAGPKCGSPAACNLAGANATQAKDYAKAMKLFLSACKRKHAAGCYNVGVLHLQGKGRPKSAKKAYKYLALGCKHGHYRGCYNAGVLQLQGAVGKPSGKRALPFFIRACGGNYLTGCFNAGVVLFKAQAGVAKDLTRAAAFFKKGCDGGDKDSCKGSRLVAQARKKGSSGGGVPGANLTVGSMTVNGLSVRSLSCRLQGAGFMAAALVVGSLAKQKRALKRCGKRGDAPRVSWSYAGGKASAVTVSGAKKKVNACVARAMKRVRAKLSGKCSAIILLGK